ncbi:Elongator complex protein 4 [Catenaria anguillulae PL171]|uniref:Elongator complex protein 4 n=1 Tax=Catenaria anguillulae PL171 TaxID=765915 RepID=A0A1Y2HSE7_9FUNG|nr:Elongator complex protein 4 [Catenaria anguillulae PL171]
MLGYFVSQGLLHGHHVLAASADVDPSVLVANAPAPVKSTASARVEAKVAKAGTRRDQGEDKMTIAWRYQNMPKVGEGQRPAPPVGVQESGAVSYCGEFDITKKLAQMDLADAADRLVHVVDLTRSVDDAFEDVYARIAKVIEEGGFLATAPAPASGPRSVLRIAIHAMCSPLWLSSNPYAGHSFLHKLKALLRRSFASAMITWSYAAATTARGPSIRALADFAVGLDAFSTSVTLPASLRNNRPSRASTPACLPFTSWPGSIRCCRQVQR